MSHRPSLREVQHRGTILAHSYRTCWSNSIPMGPVGAYQLQAAISAVHSEAAAWEETDWEQIAELYSMLARVAPSPTVTLNYAVAISEAHGPTSALRVLDPLLDDPRMSRSHRLYAVRAPILEACGRHHEALDAYRISSRLCTSIPEQRYLNSQIARLQVGIDRSSVSDS
ncbi:hypothetical protein [Microbacterium sp. ZW T5_56]|uniref:hypothetical protein n=1 Tax=Microbacterium sp. ZW T5_56 TaxID=3378081 RepID=UPI003853CD28